MGKTWSRGTNSRLPFDVNVNLNLSIGKQQCPRYVHHACFHISLPSLHDYDVKMSNFTFCKGRENKRTTTFFP